jgi:hypothetical protein
VVRPYSVVVSLKDQILGIDGSLLRPWLSGAAMDPYVLASGLPWEGSRQLLAIVHLGGFGMVLMLQRPTSCRFPRRRSLEAGLLRLWRFPVDVWMFSRTSSWSICHPAGYPNIHHSHIVCLICLSCLWRRSFSLLKIAWLYRSLSW